MLLVSDSEQDEAMFRRALGQAGLRICLTSVHSIEEAIGLLKDAPPFLRPTVIVVDLDHAKSTATELLLWLQNKPAFKDIATVIIKRHPDQEAVSRAYSLGGTSVVTKPEDPEELLKLYGSICQFWSFRESPVVADPPWDGSLPHRPTRLSP